MRRDLVVFFVGIICVATLGIGYCYQQINSPIVIKDGETYVIEGGASLFSITRQLVEQGIVSTPERLLRYYALFTRSEGTLKAGEYDLTMVRTVGDLLRLFRSGKVIERDITFLEGWTFADWRRHLTQESYIDHQLSRLSDLEVMALMGKPHVMPEGWFFPDTYRFTRGETDLMILQRAHMKMRAVLEEEWSTRSVGVVVATPYDAIILASLVEKETGADIDRGKVSRVFVNRLEKQIRLQCDPTVIYGLGNAYDGNLTRTQLREPTPYNTYTNFGLPPTPIGMPGLASIRAALHPEAGEYLYFVAKGDGTSYFSLTLGEHNEAVERFQRSGRRKDYQSAPN